MGVSEAQKLLVGVAQLGAAKSPILVKQKKGVLVDLEDDPEAQHSPILGAIFFWGYGMDGT